MFGGLDVTNDKMRTNVDGNPRSETIAANVVVRNPLLDIINNVSHSGSYQYVHDSERDIILIDKENLFVPNSVSPSLTRYRSRLKNSKVYHICFVLFYCMVHVL